MRLPCLLMVLLDQDAHPPASLHGLHRVYRLDVTPSKEPGKRRGDIEFAALRQTRHIGDRAPAIDKQEDPTFPAWELAGKCRCLQAGDNAEHVRCAKTSFLCMKFHHHSSPPYARWLAEHVMNTERFLFVRTISAR